MTDRRRNGKPISLTEAMVAAGMTQEQLADAVGTTQPYVSKWVNGKHRPGRFYRDEIEQALGYKIAWPDKAAA